MQTGVWRVKVLIHRRLTVVRVLARDVSSAVPKAVKVAQVVCDEEGYTDHTGKPIKIRVGDIHAIKRLGPIYSAGS